jgi:hypothetical protein
MTKITFPHRSRAEQIEFITGIGGYAGGRGESWPIAFNVKCYVDTSFDTLWNNYHQHYIDQSLKDDPARLEIYYECARKAYDSYEEGYFWREGIEIARENVTGSDLYNYLPDGKTKISVKFSFAGRSGGHLVIDEFEGSVLHGMTDETLYLFMTTQTKYDSSGYAEDEISREDKLRPGWVWEDWKTEDIRKLYKYLRGCEVWFSQESVDNMVQGEAANILFMLTDDKYEQAVQTIQSQQELVKSAKIVFEALYTEAIGGLGENKGDKGLELMWAFEDMATAAGIKEDELHALSQHILPLRPRS